MPITRYEIRNEYSLADPELYRAADRDDPEALLEGVAMAGLLGVLRQLGDLAEFAAEIFHDLHEDVMATAARGHGLLIRVQQLESEVPSIEKAFLSQTDHSSLFYSTGVDWRTNLRLDQNLVTRGDLPRFIMDSYEECRGPPRLFLLDKFDVAGAGSCLKRYTDPSFFKVETSGMTSLDVQRGKNIRKAKKKGPRWRNGESPEVLPTSHAKLHQLFLEERVENCVSNPARRVKLKRRLDGFPFDSRAGKSYMERLLQSPSPEHKVLNAVSLTSSLMMLPTNDHDESALEVVEFVTVSPERESKGRKISPSDREEIVLNPSFDEPNEVFRADNIREVSNSYPSAAADEISYTLDKVVGEQDIAVNGENKTEGSLTGYKSDDIASEIDNYMDAPSTMVSEMDTDSELRLKRDFTSSLLKIQPSYANGDLHSCSSDSQSTGEPTMSDEGNNLSKKETSSFSSSGSLSTSDENSHSVKFLSAGLPSADILDIDLVNDTSSYQKTTDDDFPGDQHPNPMDSDYKCSKTDAITNQRSDFKQLPSSVFCISDSIPMLSHSDSEEVKKYMIRGLRLEDMVFDSDNDGRKISLVIDQPCSPSLSDSKPRSGDDSPASPAHEHVNDEPNTENLPSIYNVFENISHKDRSIAMSSDLLLEDDSDREDISLGKNTASSSNMSNGLSQSIYDAPDMITVAVKMDDEISELTEKSCSDCSDIADFGHSTLSTEVPEEEKLTDKLDNEDSNIFRFSFFMEASHGKELGEASSSSSSMVHNANANEHYSGCSIHNQFCSENLLLPYAENSPAWPEDVIDTHNWDVVLQEESTINETSASGTPESCKVVGLRRPKVTDDLSAEKAALKSSSGTQEFLEELAGPLDKFEHDEITPYADPIGLQVDETLATTDMNLLYKSVREVEQLETADRPSPAPAVSDNANKSLNKFIEEHIPCPVDSDTEEVEDDLDSLSEIHGESGLVEEVGQAEASSPDLSSLFCNNIDNGHLKLEASDIVPDPDLDSNVAHSLDFVGAATDESLQAQIGLDREKETIQQSSPGIHVSDASYSPVDLNTEEIISQEETSELQANQFNDKLPDSEVIRMGLPPLFSVNSQQIANHNDHKLDNSSDSMLPLINYPSPPSYSELTGASNYDHYISEQPKDPLGSIFPPSNLSYESNQIDLKELPPLPPLPPVQWRMGKILQASSVTGGEIMKSASFTLLTSPPLAPSSVTRGETTKPTSFPLLTSPPLAPTDAINSSLDEMDRAFVAPEMSSEEKFEHGSSSFDANAMYEKFDLEPEIENEMPQPIVSTDTARSPVEKMNHSPIQIGIENAPNSEKVEKVENEPNNDKVENEPNDEKAEHIQEVYTMDKKIDLQPEIDNEKWESNTSHDEVSSSLEEMNHSSIHINPEIASELEQEKVQHSSSSLEANAILHETNIFPSQVGNEKLKLLMPFSVHELPLPAEEDEVSNGTCVKLPRPRNPLVNDVAALDKSKLRKVTERIIPEILKVDERDSLLAQIRNKSFSLKPAMASRPSIRGPRTNLKVAAILEKANRIRQAFAGSDEDDEDNWSDS